MDGVWTIDAAAVCRPEYVKGSSYLLPRAEREGLRMLPDGTASVQGFVHRIRPMGGVNFVMVRTARAIVQCVWNGELPEGLCDGACVDARGTVLEDERAQGGFELMATAIYVLSRPAAPAPLSLGRRRLEASLEVLLDIRPFSLRHPKERAVWKIEEAMLAAYRTYMSANGFTEVKSPKIVAGGVEGGANVFKLDYFGKPAVLAQSPQSYKQMLVGVYGRVFETAPVYRAEKHNTTRHLNEYIGLDFEMGFIQDFTDIMRMEAGMLRHMMATVADTCAYEIAMLEAVVPEVGEIPVVKFKQAKELLAEKYSIRNRGADLSPEEEVHLGQWAKETFGSDFVFITHYPSGKRPFYTRDDPEDPGFTCSFDLLFRGLEITTGGQRVHDYESQVEKMRSRGLDPADFEGYLMMHKYGMPPHGGLGIGLERIAVQLLGMKNIRHASLFPRDTGRVEP
jgi:nondiscriminating aspartyl-tRNA synthetase